MVRIYSLSGRIPSIAPLLGRNLVRLPLVQPQEKGLRGGCRENTPPDSWLGVLVKPPLRLQLASAPADGIAAISSNYCHRNPPRPAFEQTHSISLFKRPIFQSGIKRKQVSTLI